MYRSILLSIFVLLFFSTNLKAQLSYSIELEEFSLQGTPTLHSFSFAQWEGKWVFVGGRTNGLHGFTPLTAFPRPFANKYIYVVDTLTGQVWSRDIFLDLPSNIADPLRSTNMQHVQVGSKLYVNGGYGIDTSVNNFRTFWNFTELDLPGIINSITSGTSIQPHVKNLFNQSLRICGGEIARVGEFFYLVGGHNFNGPYSLHMNNQVYSPMIKRFKIDNTGQNFAITDYTEWVDTNDLHRRDMNLVNAVKPDGSPYLILYGGVFRKDIDLPFLNPVYIDENGISLDVNYEQKIGQYTAAHFTMWDDDVMSMNTAIFGGNSLYFWNDTTQQLEIDSLVPFIKDIVNIEYKSDGSTIETMFETKLPGLLGTNAKFILNKDVPHFENGVIKFSELNGQTMVGYIYGGIESEIPNTMPTNAVHKTRAVNRIFRVYVTPEDVSIDPISSTVPDKFELHQNFPNPFNPVTNIRFDVAKFSNSVSLKVYSTLGKEVAVLVNQSLQPGAYEVSFNSGNLSSGIYFYELRTDDFRSVKKMVLIR